MALGVNWTDKFSNEVYQEIPRASETVRSRCLLPSHIQRHPELTAHHFLFWEPVVGGGLEIRDDTGLASEAELMEDRELWCDLVARTLKPP